MTIPDASDPDLETFRVVKGDAARLRKG